MSSAAPLPSPARVLVVGGGGRENALAWALARSQGVEAVWVAPGNGGTAELAGVTQLAIAESDQPGLLQACRDHAIELVVVGPEAPWLPAWPTNCAPPTSPCSVPAPTAPCWRPASSGPRP